jgi:hypothetical protein
MSLFRNRTSNSKFLLVFSFARILLCCNSVLPHETKGMMKWVVLLLQQLLAHGQEPTTIDLQLIKATSSFRLFGKSSAAAAAAAASGGGEKRVVKKKLDGNLV